MTSHRFTNLTDDEMRFVSAECEAFENAIADEQPARIDDHLASAPLAIRTALFCELLAIEIEHRQSRGWVPSAAEYCERFPELEQEIRRVFDRVFAAISPTDLSPTELSPQANADRQQPEQQTRESKVSSQRNTAMPGRGTVVQYMGDYEILDVLGQGGMGVVYVARQVSLNRQVAIKMIKPGLLANDEGLRRFRNEADAVALLDHPGIVPIYEVSEHEGQHYFSMKLVEGGSLATRLREYLGDPRAAARIVAETAEAVAHAHTRGILHRDLKPANLIIDSEGHAHVTDFGLAKQVDAKPESELTQTGQVLGTPAYMSPEQASGQRTAITTASDVYGLGAVLYAVLTGQAPFRGDSVVETLDAVRNLPPTAPKRLNSDTPRDLETIALKCLEKDPRRRYLTAQGLANDLHNWLEHRPIKARRVGAVERAWLWCKRRPAVAALSAATVIAIFAGTVSVIAVQAASYRELAAENVATKRAEDLAEKRLDRAMASIQDYYSGFNQDAITSEQIPLAVREQLLEKPRKFYEALTEELAENKESSPRELRLLAAGRLSLGEIQLLLGRHDEALSQTDKAITQFETLVETPGSDMVACRTGLAQGYCRMSEILRSMGDMSAAKQPLDNAAALGETLANAEPDDPAFRVLLAQIYNDRGHLLQATGDILGAQAAHGKGVEQYIALTQLDANPEYEIGLATGYNSLGLAYHATSDWTAAKDAYANAIQTNEKLVAATPSNAVYQDSLASSHTNLGLLLHAAADYHAACDSHRQAAEYSEKLVAAHPGVPEYLSGLAAAYTNLAASCTYIGETAAATEANRKAVERYQMLVAARPGVASFQDGLARSFVNLGTALKDQNQSEAASEAYQAGIEISKSLAAAHPEVPVYRYVLAVTYSNLARIQQDRGDLNSAKSAYVDAIAVLETLLKDQPDDPNYQYAVSVFHYNLGELLQNQGDSAGALRQFRLSQKTAIEGTPVAQELPQTILEAEAELAAAARLPAVLKGELQPRDAAEQLTFARLCDRRSEYVAATKFWEQAFRDDPQFMDDRKFSHRFDAACAALMAAAGHDDTQVVPDAAEQSRLRTVALQWLTAELDAMNLFLPTVPAEARPNIIKNLNFWQANNALESVTAPFAALPESDHPQWHDFWENYQRVLKTDISKQ